MRDLDTETLSAYLDGDLPEGDRAAVAAALATDPELAARVEELATLKALAREARPAPLRRDLWPEIRAAVQARGPWWAVAWDALQRPALAWSGTAAACAVMVVVLVAGLQPPPPPGPVVVAAPAESELAAARAAYLAAIQRLAQTAAAEAARLPPEAQEKLRASLAQVDAAITECERALAVAPLDPVGQESLLALYDEKIRVLRAAVRAAGEGGASS
jgi:hypothetical protein